MAPLPPHVALSTRRAGRDFRIRCHRLVARDLDAIATLTTTPHKGSVPNEIAPGIRVIPAGRKAVVAFLVDDEAAEVLICAVTYGGADWIRRTGARRR
jgi:toxin ParE1/3/4